MCAVKIPSCDYKMFLSKPAVFCDGIMSVTIGYCWFIVALLQYNPDASVAIVIVVLEV